MLVYIFDEETKEFLREEEAHLDPLETQLKGENVYLLPANATFEKPLDKKEGKAIIFDGSSWKLVDDNRGKFTIKDNQIEEIKTLDPVERVLTDEELNGLNNGTLIIVNNEVMEKPAPTIEEQNELIRQTRQQLFTEQADPLKYDYEECLARYGETDERTIEVKNVWLAKKDEIRENNPYISEPTETKAFEVLDDSESAGLSWKNE